MQPPSECALNILHVVPTYLPAVRYGGPIYSVHGLCKALVARGHSVRVVTTNVDGPGVSDVPVGSAVSLDGVAVTYYPSDRLRSLYWSPQMKRALPSHVGWCDVMHLHSVFLWPSVEASRLARARGIPYVLAPRGALVPELIRKKSWLKKTAWLQLVERHALRGAAALHVTSEAEYRDAARLRLPMPPACVVANGVEFPSDDVLTISRLDLAREASHGPYVLYVGRINWKKGLDRLLAAARDTELRVLLAGNDEEGYREKLQLLIKEYRLEGRVTFLGHVDGTDKFALMAAARCLVLPSYNENFGNTVIEAMSVGCPVVVTLEVGAADVVRRAEGGLVVPGEPDALRNAMSRFYTDDVLRHRMGEQGRAYVRQHLSWDGAAETMVRHYQSLLRR